MRGKTMMTKIETFEHMIRLVEQADTVLASGPLAVRVRMDATERATFLRVLAIWIRDPEMQSYQGVSAECDGEALVYVRAGRPSRYLDLPWPEEADRDRLAALSIAASQRLLGLRGAK